MSFVDGSTGSITLESDVVEQKWRDHGHNYSPSLDGDDYEHMKDFQKLKKVILPGVEGIGSILDR